MTDRFTVRTVVLGLAFIVLAIVASLVYILAVVSVDEETKRQIVTALLTMGGTALGALAGVLVSTRSPEPVIEPPAVVPPAA